MDRIRNQKQPWLLILFILLILSKLCLTVTPFRSPGFRHSIGAADELGVGTTTKKTLDCRFSTFAAVRE